MILCASTIWKITWLTTTSSPLQAADAIQWRTVFLWFAKDYYIPIREDLIICATQRIPCYILSRLTSDSFGAIWWYHHTTVIYPRIERRLKWSQGWSRAILSPLSFNKKFSGQLPIYQLLSSRKWHPQLQGFGPHILMLNCNQSLSSMYSYLFPLGFDVLYLCVVAA